MKTVGNVPVLTGLRAFVPDGKHLQQISRDC